MKIKAKVQTHKTQEIDVQFPLYLKHGDIFDSGGWYDTYCRYDEDGKLYSITEHDDHWEFRIEDGGKEQMAADLGYHLIEQGVRRNEAAEFYAKLDEMIVALQAVPRS